MLFQYKAEGGEKLRDHSVQDVEMADQSNPSARGGGDQQIKFPCLQYLAEFTCFAPEFDYVRAYEIPP